jgi:glutamate carboxypeptidase
MRASRNYGMQRTSIIRFRERLFLDDVPIARCTAPMQFHCSPRAGVASRAALATVLVTLAGQAGAAPDAKVLAAVEACAPDARALLEELVGIDSGTSDIAGLAALTNVLKPRLDQLGAAVESVPSAVANLAPSLVATFTGTGRGRVLLIAHMDTVFQPGTAAQRPYNVVGDHGVGPGAGDDKQGIVTALCALRALRETGYRDFASITLILNSNEEIGSPGTRDLIAAKARESDAVLNLERGVPPDGVVVARKGSATATIEIQGRAAHSGLEPEKGRNAILEAAHQIALAAALPNPALETTANVTTIQGGNATNVIPDHATIKVDVRAFSSEEFDRVEKELERMARDTVVPDVKITAALSRGFPPWPRSASTDALLARAQRLYAEIDRRLQPIVVGSSADVSVAAETGTPSIDGFGSLAGGAHGVDDYVDLSSIVPRTYLLARMLMDLGHNPPARAAPR